MTDKTAVLHQRLLNSRAYLDAVLDKVGNRWSERVYEDGEQWDVRQVLVHVAEADRGQSTIVMAVARGENPVPADFDIQRYNQRIREKKGDVMPEQARAMLTESRAALLTWLDAQDDEALTREGRHASLNILTVEQFLKVISNHERDHARDIAAALNLSTMA